MTTERPFVIAHRGASAYRPEHTLEGYALAIEQGADAIEPDLVVTRDGVLICRHENEIGGTTDVAQHPEFAGRRTRKRIDAEDVEGWFAEDFTLTEIRTLRARERLPALRPDSASHDGRYGIPTFAEVIELAAKAPRPVAIYPETKHPTYFEHEGRHLDGTPIAQSLSALLVAELVRSGFTDPARVYIQSFELANLIELRLRLLPQAGIDARLMQLFGDIGGAAPASAPFALPYDLRRHAARGDDFDALYPGLRERLPQVGGKPVTYADLAAPPVLAWMRERYAFGIAPWKDNLLMRARDAEGRVALTGAASPLPALAHAAGLKVHTYTLRAEEPFLVRDEHGATLSMEQELQRLLDAGIDGYFIDFPDRGATARKSRSP
ncbi:MAG TPA: glycerophosphodiester phosphodiesterase family protein [Tahibacter sp.]|uniref:glycerophosphodiester phosphodiesterase family protein n=1 Tax=Tahibacter sp. TaxID=2056211 RepID=UPI002BB08003|nr:glycerophosphodiester phosphodiesterase family protein [Tahibacter sp.]HSX61102.1 glycerophosphodiester phosphodiesterase family protein [Tahibacter sp.]